MIEHAPDEQAAVMPMGKSRWTERLVLGVTCALVIGIYTSATHSGVLELHGRNAADTYYNLLVQGFRAGQLSLKNEVPAGLAQLADPYDPAANARYRAEPYRVLDMSYYKGRLYLYFGITPALILFWPFTAVTGHYLFHRQAVTVFCALGFLGSAGLLRAVWRRYYAEVSLWVVAACVLALGLATGVPVLLTRSDVYEVTISCGYLLVMLALGAIWFAVHEPEPRKRSGWLAMASVAYGLAVGARPSLLFGAVILLVPVAQARRERRPMGALLTTAVGPITLIGLGLMLYNFLRFDDPFEFGWRYQLNPYRQNAVEQFSLRNLWPNFRTYFLEPARWSGRLPFVHNDLERPLGILTNIPLVWLAPLGAWLAWRSGSSIEARANLRWFVAAVGLVAGMNTVVLGLFHGANFRYDVDFLPSLMVLAAVGILGLEQACLAKRRGQRRAMRWSWGMLLGFSVAFNVLVAVVNSANAKCYKGNALLRAGRIPEALAQYKLALRINPDVAEVHNNLGVALERSGKIEEAIEHYEQALRIKPGLAEAHYDLGGALQQLGRVQEAIGHYEQALRNQPGYSAAHCDLGGALQRLGRLAEAMEHYQQALRIEPDYIEARNALGAALAQLGRVEEAVGHFEQVLRSNPDYADAHFNLGVAFEQLGLVSDAISHYEQVLRIRPDDAETQNRLARLRSIQ